MSVILGENRNLRTYSDSLMIPNLPHWPPKAAADAIPFFFLSLFSLCGGPPDKTTREIRLKKKGNTYVLLATSLSPPFAFPATATAATLGLTSGARSACALSVSASPIA